MCKARRQETVPSILGIFELPRLTQTSFAFSNKYIRGNTGLDKSKVGRV